MNLPYLQRGAPCAAVWRRFPPFGAPRRCGRAGADIARSELRRIKEEERCNRSELGTVLEPRIDSIAREGLCLNNYTVEARCTPSRAAIMTPRFLVRSRTTRAPVAAQDAYGLAPWGYTLGELCSDADHATAAYGRWQLRAFMKFSRARFKQSAGAFRHSTEN